MVKVDNRLINIEVNSGFYDGVHRRNFGYAGSKYSEEVKIGENYLDMNEVIQINFTWGLPRKYSILGEYLLVDKKTEIKFVDNFSIFEYNMDKIRELWYSGDKEYEFLAILDFNKEELKKIGKGDEYMSEFKKKIESLNDNREYKEFLTAEEDMKKTNNTFKEIGRREGFEDGKVLEKVEIAKKLLNKNMDIKEIAEVTGLSLEKIQKLKE